MKRILFYVVLPLVAAVASLVNVASFWLENLLRESWVPLLDLAWYGSLAAIAILAVIAILAARWRPVARRVTLAVAVVLILAVGFVPRAVDLQLQMSATATDQAAGADTEMQFQSDLLDRSGEVDQRITAKMPYAAAETLDFLEFAADADLSYRSLPDHTPEVFALVEQAIAGGILDPNALMTTPTADSPAETVTLAFYDKRIRPGSPSAIKKHDWDVLEILVAHRADLSSPAAASLRADLARTVILGPGRFLSLK
jgi:hypothetical protein